MNIREVIAGLNPYANWKPIRKYQGGFNSDGVYEMPNGVVKKVYNPNDPGQLRRFEHERMILDYLKRSRCNFVPQLLHVDLKNGSLYMTNCGVPPIKRTPKLEKEVDRLLHVLEERYRVIRKENIGRVKYRYSGTITNSGLHNITQRDGKTFIIDFGSDQWLVLPHYQNPNAPIQDTQPIIPIPLSYPKTQPNPFSPNTPADVQPSGSQPPKSSCDSGATGSAAVAVVSPTIGALTPVAITQDAVKSSPK